MGAPATLPADFSRWDQAPPKSLPADFAKWDSEKEQQARTPGAPPKPPNVSPEFTNPLPTDDIPVVGPMLQPFGEVAAGMKYDPAFRKETLKYGAGSAALTGTAVAAPAIATAVPAVAAGAHNLMKKHPMASYVALEAAKSIPGVGKYASKIPSWLPLLMGGREEPAVAAEAEAPAAAGEVGVLEAPTPPVAARPQPAPPSVEWPPPEPTGSYDKPVPAVRGVGEAQDDEAVREGIRDRVAQADRKVRQDYRERNDVSVPKGVLTGAVNQPAKLTKNRIPKAKPVASATTPDTGDFTSILEESLEQARKKKGK